ncbi:hypothetical protein P691DRAFT_159661 [Macrolepiota fuliginosa MF-IS2]|uniref:Ribosome assembly protein 3 n=1 Tax=Macrolepiota fuliginosa MF-IS2 TaxID=1400762 RepID=A0A9P5XBI3_9AGAR|nr:hypothetical protein P691DRAFT_159661 [Macrolepiota fuliginosa MF-IS2]
MPPAKAAKPAARKRTRKRKRRAASSSSSSSSSDSSSSEDESPSKIIRTVTKVTKPVEESSESESDSESSDSSSSESEASIPPSTSRATAVKPAAPQKSAKLRRSPSPSPPPAEIPSFLPSRDDPNAEEKEKQLKEKFRKFWMSSVADGFRDDLEEIRKEPNLGPGRLALLIDSLASGAEVFSLKTDDGVTEMDVVMG